jgi:nucleoside-diphosphate-sugar epimerase
MVDPAPTIVRQASSDRVLVTGAGGFIGQPLCQTLSAEGYRATGTIRDKKSDGLTIPGVDFQVTGALETFAGWTSLLENVKAVIHLAAKVHVMGEQGQAALAEYRRVNVGPTEALLRAAATAGVRRFIFVSSIKAIGEGGTTPYDEETAAKPTDPYGLSKLEAEQVVTTLGEALGVETVILRLPLVCGPGVRANFLRLMKLVDQGIPLPLDSVTNRRSMIYLGNLVDALRVCLHHKKAAGEIFMVSDGEDLSTPGLIREISGALHRTAYLFRFPVGLLKMAGKLTGMDLEIQRLLGSLYVDTDKIRSKLDWVPPYTVRQGIARTVQWYLASAQFENSKEGN